MSLKAQLEAIIYAAETPITLEQIIQLVKDSVVAGGAADDAEVKSRVRSCLEELAGEYGSSDHGIEIRWEEIDEDISVPNLLGVPYENS